jgi:MGT family glycosyltransferase
MKILFGNVPVDGHFNPLTGLALHLKNQGHDVRWYAGNTFASKLEKMGIPHYPFVKAKEINQFNIDEIFPERKALKAGIPKLKFDLKNFFIYRGPEYFEDIKKIYEEFRFEVMISDSAFTAGTLVKHKLGVKIVPVGIFPLMQTSKDLAPYGVGLPPDNSFGGRTKQSIMRFMAKNVLFKESTNEFNKIMKSYGAPTYDNIIFDIPIKEGNVYLQSGVPGFEYKRSDTAPTVNFVGMLRTFRDPAKKTVAPGWMNRLDRSKKVILVSQGTMEPDHTKLIHPTLEALKNSDYLVLVATGHQGTAELRKKYPQQNFIIEDFIDFDLVMPQCDLYVTNGGYGGTLFGIEHGLPMVCAGINEGKNEICARIGYFNLGVNLNTENPKPEQLKAAIEKVLADKSYRRNVENLRDEFAKYDSLKIAENLIASLS